MELYFFFFVILFYLFFFFLKKKKKTSNTQISACLFHNQGPVVQSVVSLTSSLRVISLTALVDSIHNILIFFAEKM